MSGSQTDKKRPFAAVDSVSDTPTEAAKRFFTTGQYSDLIVACGGKEWKVHKFQLCGQSEYFSTMCSSGFKEAQENKVVLDDDDPNVIEAVLEWLYTSEYTYRVDVYELYKGKCDEPKSKPGSDSKSSYTHPGRMLFDVDVFRTADKLMIANSKEYAAFQFGERCVVGWGEKEFASAVIKVYEVARGINVSLKHRITTMVVLKSGELLCDKQKYPALHAALRSSADFSTDVAIKMAKQPPQKVVVNKPIDRPIDRPVDRIVYVNDPTMTKYQCPRCHQLFSVGPTPTTQTRFGCPRACVGHNDFQWWAQHRQ